MQPGNELSQRRYAQLTIEQRKQRWFYRQASTICWNLGIIHHSRTLVAYIGDGNGENNVDAVKRWLETESRPLTEEYGPLDVVRLTDIFRLHLCCSAPAYMVTAPPRYGTAHNPRTASHSHAIAVVNPSLSDAFEPPKGPVRSTACP